MKKAKIIFTILTFLLGMAGCLLCSINPTVEGFLLQYAIWEGAVFACMFIVGIIILFLTAGSNKENVCDVGEMISLPFLYWGILGAALIVFRIAVQRILATEGTTQFVMIDSRLLVTAFVIVTVAVAGILFIIFWRTAVEDGFLVFMAAVAIAVILTIFGIVITTELSRKLYDGSDNVTPTKPAVAATLPESEREKIYGTDF